MTTRHSSRRIPGYSRAASLRAEVGQLAGQLRAGEPAAGDEERQEPAPLVGIGLEVGQLEHLDDVVLEPEAVVEALQPVRVLGEARVGLEVLSATEGDDRHVVPELGPDSVAAEGDDPPLVEVDRLDLGHVHLGRREHAPSRVQDVARQDPSRHHFADQAVEGEEVVAVDDGHRDLSATDVAAERSGHPVSDESTAQDEHVRGLRHRSETTLPRTWLGEREGGKRSS